MSSPAHRCPLLTLCTCLELCVTSVQLRQTWNSSFAPEISEHACNADCLGLRGLSLRGNKPCRLAMEIGLHWAIITLFHFEA